MEQEKINVEKSKEILMEKAQKEEKELVDDIEACNPDIVWVGLSTPKQEIFMSEYLPKLKILYLFIQQKLLISLNLK